MLHPAEARLSENFNNSAIKSLALRIIFNHHQIFKNNWLEYIKVFW